MTVIEMYVDLIRKGIKTLDDVPKQIKESVEKLLKEEKGNENKQ